MEIKLAENIQMLRKKKKMTQEELALIFGVTSQSISKWELGLSCPDVMTLPKIAEYFEVSIDELMGYKPITSLNSLYLQIKNLLETETNTKSEKYDLIYRIALLTISLIDKHDGNIVNNILSNKTVNSLSMSQGDGGFICQGHNTIMISSFRDFPSYDNNTIRKLHKYLTSINKVNTLKVLFAMFSLEVSDGLKKWYTMDELVSKTGISENDIWLAFNDLNISVEYNDDNKEMWSLSCINEVPTLINLLIIQMMNINNGGGKAI